MLYAVYIPSEDGWHQVVSLHSTEKSAQSEKAYWKNEGLDAVKVAALSELY
jgi:hypothetical protein